MINSLKFKTAEFKTTLKSDMEDIRMREKEEKVVIMEPDFGAVQFFVFCFFLVSVHDQAKSNTLFHFRK